VPAGAVNVTPVPGGRLVSVTLKAMVEPCVTVAAGGDMDSVGVVSTCVRDGPEALLFELPPPLQAVSVSKSANEIAKNRCPPRNMP